MYKFYGADKLNEAREKQELIIKASQDRIKLIDEAEAKLASKICDEWDAKISGEPIPKNTPHFKGTSPPDSVRINLDELVETGRVQDVAIEQECARQVSAETVRKNQQVLIERQNIFADRMDRFADRMDRFENVCEEKFTDLYGVFVALRNVFDRGFDTQGE